MRLMSATKSPVSTCCASAGPLDVLDAALSGDGNDLLRQIDHLGARATADVIGALRRRPATGHRGERRHHVVDMHVVGGLRAIAIRR